MKKVLLLFLIGLGLVTLSACQPEEEVEPTTYTVTFNSDGGSDVAALTVEEGLTATAPTNPTKEGYVFRYWYETDTAVAFDFTTTITADLTLSALWEEDIPEVTDEDRINDDIADYLTKMYETEFLLYTPRKGALYSSSIDWDIDSDYISDDGVILPAPPGTTETLTATYTGTFTLNDAEVVYTFEVPIEPVDDVVLTTMRTLPFESLTTEYDVADGELDLFYEEDGFVPYVKVTDFFDLLVGFIDPEVDITFTTTGDELEMFYQYYDEDYDETYDLIVTINATDNTVITNDPGFYWAYVYTTETNYGRHIDYVTDHPDASFEEGDDIVFDLDDYNMDVVVYEDDIVMPYYMVNQLFAGQSYFNVYYNYDGLYGIYSLPDDGSRELRTIQTSSLSGDDIPADLLIHTFDMLGFVLNNLYGLKDIMDVDDYYELLYQRKDDLLVEDPEDFEDGLRDLLLLDIDEPHTSYGYHSYFNGARYDGPVTNNLSVYGPRFRTWYYDGLVDTDDQIAAKWGITSTGWAAGDPKRPNYWFLDGTTAMLSLDDFYTADIDETATYDATIAADILEVADASVILPAIAEGTKFFNFNSTTEEDIMFEVLVKGVSAGYIDTYEAALLAMGYTYHWEDNNDEDKQIGYYTISVPQTEGDPIDYMLQVVYDAEFELFYVGVIDRVPLDFGSAWPMNANIEDTIHSDSAIYMEMMLQELLEEQPATTDIILDITWNTGGNIGALYRVVGFITDEPFAVSGLNGDTGGNSTYFVDIPGIDAFDHLTWALLTTPTSFSAANELATIFMANDLGPIIGLQSGGGACSITPILLPNGTAFTMSSNNISAYRTGSGTEEDPYVYQNTEFGITPDYLIDISEIYDEAVLLSILLND